MCATTQCCMHRCCTRNLQAGTRSWLPVAVQLQLVLSTWLPPKAMCVRPDRLERTATEPGAYSQRGWNVQPERLERAAREAGTG
eukprot:357757-Chlamydomonas_euryale.AAC.2